MANVSCMNEEYVEGTAAPAFDFSKEAARRQAIAEENERRRLEEEEAHRLHRVHTLACQKRKSRINMVAMIGATALVMVLCVSYINLRAEYNKRLNHVTSLKAQLVNLIETNNVYEKRIEASVNLEEIRDKAINELKMVYPAEGQIQYYHIDNTDYMEQYRDIPSGKDNTVFGMIFTGK